MVVVKKIQVKTNIGKGKRLEITTNLSMIKLQGKKNYPSLVGMCTYMNPY